MAWDLEADGEVDDDLDARKDELMVEQMEEMLKGFDRKSFQLRRLKTGDR